jgi:hypothetical protein
LECHRLEGNQITFLGPGCSAAQIRTKATSEILTPPPCPPRRLPSLALSGTRNCHEFL